MRKRTVKILVGTLFAVNTFWSLSFEMPDAVICFVLNAVAACLTFISAFWK